MLKFNDYNPSVTAYAAPPPFTQGRLYFVSLYFLHTCSIKTKNKSSGTNMAKPIGLHYRMQTTEYLN